MYRLTIVAVTLCALSIAVLAHHGPPPHIKEAIKKCVNELGGDETVIEKIHHREDINDPKLKCLDACIMKGLGHMNEDGTINKDKSIDGLPSDMPDREKLIEIINMCADEKGDDECDTASRIHKCMKEKMPKKHPV